MTTYSTDFLAFGTGAGANVVSQATFAGASYVSSGFSSGTAQSAALNKVWRQSSFVAAGLTQWLANAQAANVSDDGNLSNFVTLLTAALPSTKTAQSWAGAQTFASPISINGAAGTNRQIFIQSGGSTRWSIYADTSAESGGNAGSTFEIGRYSDAGTYLDSPMAIARATGMVTFNDGLTVNGGIAGALTGNVTGNVTGNCSGSSGSCTGNAATATKLATARTLTFTGSATGSGSFDGSGNVSIAMTAPNSAANTIRGNNTASAAAPGDLTASQVLALLGLTAGAAPTTAKTAWEFQIPTPSGNIIVQGGYYTGPVSETSYAVTFGTAFASACWGAFAILDGAGGSTPTGISVSSAPTTTGVSFQPVGYQSGSVNPLSGFWWFAVGK